MEIRVRYAPSPTGYLHIGGARTAVFNYLFAKHQKGKFIVRIEDTDLERNIKDGINSQLDNLRWMGLTIDETVDIGGPYEPYQQTERLAIYQNYANQLIAKKLAYYCFCTTERIEKLREKQSKGNNLAFQYDGKCRKLSEQQVKKLINQKTAFAIRLQVPANHNFTINDLVRGNVNFNSNDIGDFIIIKTNGIATYNFAVVIDDHLMKISHVLRGAEHISNTPRQLLIYDYFQWKAPVFGHLTLIINEQGKKLSKRDGHLLQFVHQYRENGFLPAALFNFISLLGWSPHEEREIYSISELIKIFNSKFFSKAPSMFDIKKLMWINNFYIKKLNPAEYLALVKPFVQQKYQWSSHDEIWWNELLLIYQKQLMFGQEIIDLIALFFQSEFQINETEKAILLTETSQKVLHKFNEILQTVDEWNETQIKDLINQVKNATKISGRALFMPIRIACTGQNHGPELPITLKLLGKKTLLQRLKQVKFN